MRPQQPRARFLLTFLLSLFLVACFGGHGGGGGGGNGGGGGGNGGGGGGNGGGGGGNGGGGGGGGTSGGTVTILEPTVSGGQVVAGSTLDFAAKVSGGTGSALSWGIQSGDTCTATNGVSSLGTAGGSGTLGTMPVTTANKAVATYTAPPANVLPASGFITITVTALQSPSTTGPCLVVYVVATTNNLLFGNYVFRLKGFSSNSSGLPYGIIGRFRFDGVGSADLSSGVSAGFEDVNIAQADGSSAAFTKVAFTGGYSMDSPSHGTMKLTITSPPAAWAALANPPPKTMNFSFTLSLDAFFGGLIETDGSASPAYVGSGDFQFQFNSVNFTTAKIVNFYTVSLAGPAGAGASAVNKGFIGRVDLTATSASAGMIVSGVNSTGDDQSGAGEQTLTGNYAIDDQANGHGTLSITGTLGATNTPYTISFYVGYPGFFYALRIDKNAASGTPDGILLGTVNRLPATAPFTNTSLGSALFEMLGITTNGHASAAVGVLVGGAQISPPSTTNGFLQGIIDLNDGGSVPSPLPIPINSSPPNLGTFTIAPIGRGILNIAIGSVTYHFVFYLNGQGGGYLLEQPASDGSNRGRSGRFFPQTVTSGGAGTFIASTEVATAKSQNGLAVIPISASGGGGGAGNFQNAAEYLSIFGMVSPPQSVSATFTATDANNRGTIAITSGSLAGSGSAAYYLVSNTEVIVVSTDGNNTDPQIILLTNTLPVNR